MRIIEKYAHFLVIILSSLFVCIVYKDVLFSLNEYLFNGSSDAIKNYFTYASQIKTGSNIDSVAMNYPYGEHSLYLDCIPFYSWGLSLLSVIFPEIMNYSIGILNFTMLFSIVLTSYFIFLILKELKTNYLIGIFSSVSIAVLAPQIDRIEGHFALSFSFFIPMIWYFLLRFKRATNKFAWSLLIFLSCLCLYFTHAYLGMIAVLFLICSHTIDFLLTVPKKRFSVKEISFVMLQTILPLAVFWLFVKLTDTHTGRTTNPSGFFEHVTTFSSVLTPQSGSLHDVYSRYFDVSYSWEGLAYIGFGSVLILLFIFIVFLLRVLKIFTITSLKFEKQQFKFIVTTIVLSIFFLILGMGYPFKFGNEKVLDWFPVVKNFRGIGRFAWVFYFGATITSVYIVNQLYQKSPRSPKILLVVLVLPLTYFVEGYEKHIDLSERITSMKNVFSLKNKDAYFVKGINAIQLDSFQAILPLPYYHIGSENYTREAENQVYILSMAFQYHSGIPLVSNYSTRTSIWESKNLMQLFTPNYFEKPYLQDVNSGKPFLILKVNSVVLSEEETEVLNRGELLFEGGMFSLFRITKENLLGKKTNEALAQIQKIKNELKFKNDYYMNDTTSFFQCDKFENSSSKITHTGKGAYEGYLNQYNLIQEYATHSFESGKTYRISFWLNNSGPNYGQDVFNSVIAFIQRKKETGEIDWITTITPKISFNIHDDWSLVEMDFVSESETDEISLYILGSKKQKTKFWLDDLLVREKSNSIYEFFNKNEISKNTWLIKEL